MDTTTYEALKTERANLMTRAWALTDERNALECMGDGNYMAEFGRLTKEASALFQAADVICKRLAKSEHRYGDWRSPADRTLMTFGYL